MDTSPEIRILEESDVVRVIGGTTVTKVLGIMVELFLERKQPDFDVISNPDDNEIRIQIACAAEVAQVLRKKLIGLDS